VDAQTLVGLLAEPDRRAVAAAMILGASTLDDITTSSGVDEKGVVDALSRLQRGGLVEQDDARWYFLGEAFKLAARAGAREDRSEIHGSLVDGRLVRMPTKRTKRLDLLDHLAQRFEPGRRYTEREVNASLAQVSEDTATLRRYLVDERFLDREDGEYWRSGGTVDLP
jgi:hypothetical protein